MVRISGWLGTAGHGRALVRGGRRRCFRSLQRGQLVAYGETWVDHDEGEVELARLIVDPARRGQGIGRILVGELVVQAVAHYAHVFMRVHPDNATALRCYAGAKFVRVAAEQEAEWNAPQPVPYVWLTYRP